MTLTEQNARLDRTAFSAVDLSEADDELNYWLSQPPQERWRGIELSRQILYGYSDSSIRLQRVLEVVELKEG